MKKFNMPRSAGLVVTVLWRMCNVVIVRKFAKVRREKAREKNESREKRNVEFDLISIRN